MLKFLKNMIRPAVNRERDMRLQNATYLGNGLILARTRWDGHVVVPGYNVDVAVGIVRDGIHEPWTTRLVQELLRPGETYVNVGANFGYFTCLGARIVGSGGKVVSVEANPHVFSILMKTILWAGIVDRVAAYNRAAYLHSGAEFDFTFDYQYIGGGHIRHDVEASAVQTGTPFWSPEALPHLLEADGRWNPSRGLLNFFKVQSLALDDITTGMTADLIHCDVEQAEPFVLVGARNLISRSPRCKIIFEWSGYAYDHGNEDYRTAVRDMWDLLVKENFVVRYLKPMLHDNGAIEVSAPLTFEELLTSPHGDYVALRKGQDPWG